MLKKTQKHFAIHEVTEIGWQLAIKKKKYCFAMKESLSLMILYMSQKLCPRYVQHQSALTKQFSLNFVFK